MSERFEKLKNWVVDELLLCMSTSLQVLNCEKFLRLCFPQLQAPLLTFVFRLQCRNGLRSFMLFHFSSVFDVKVQVEVDCVRYCCVLLAIPCCDDMEKLVMQIYSHHLVRASSLRSSLFCGNFRVISKLGCSTAKRLTS